MKALYVTAVLLTIGGIGGGGCDRYSCQFWNNPGKCFLLEEDHSIPAINIPDALTKGNGYGGGASSISGTGIIGPWAPRKDGTCHIEDAPK